MDHRTNKRGLADAVALLGGMLFTVLVAHDAPEAPKESPPAVLHP